MNQVAQINKEKKVIQRDKGTKGDELCKKGLNVKVGLIPSSIFRYLNR